MAWNKAEQPIVVKEGVKRHAWCACGLALLVCILALVGVVCWTRFNTSPNESDGQPESTRVKGGKIVRHEVRAQVSPQDAVRKAMPRTLPKKVRKRREGRTDAEMFSHLSGEDRKNAEAVQAALDADDLKATVEAAKHALTSTNLEVRLNAVEALGWFGAQALPELTGCMADADEEVRDAAENQWELAVQEVDNPDDRFDLVAAAFATLTDENQLRSLGGLLSCAATEAIDGEEDETEAAEKRLQVVQTLADIIEGGGMAGNVEAAKEAYNDITGNEWKGMEEAQRYLDDPENYE